MLPRERVEAVLRHRKPDRIPIYAWLTANLDKAIAARWGSVAALEDRYEFDFVHLFGGPGCLNGQAWEALKSGLGRPPEPSDVLDFPLSDPDARPAYDGLVAEIRHHKERRGRFVYVQTPGIFEATNGWFGIEEHLAYMASEPAQIARIYRRQAEWNRRFAMNCLDLGVDMVHVSDDWGGQHGLLFSPKMWHEFIEPNHRLTAEAVKRRGAWLSLHSDGNVLELVGEIIGLGYDVFHPWQESAGMPLELFRERWRDRLVVMGGLDVQTTIGFGRLEHLSRDIHRVADLFRDGGLLYCTSHFVQDHCTLDELQIALDTLYAAVRLPGQAQKPD